MSRPAIVEIDREAFQHNLQKVKMLAPNKTVMAVVKANAYGHEIAPLITALKYTDAIGVCCIEEALELRQQRLTQPIMLMEGFFEEQELSVITANDFHIVLHDVEQIKVLEKSRIKNNTKIVAWLKVNAGMNRLGFQPEVAKKIYEQITNLPCLKNSINFMSHFSDADRPEDPKTRQQLNNFIASTQGFSGLRSIANSAAILAFPESYFDWVRPGIMLYGISPFENKTGLDFDLKPVMTLHSAIIAMRKCKKGDAIGYGSTWICPKDMNIGVVAMGYGDGYPRHAKSGTPVLVNQQEARLVGRVSMDMLTVDLGEQPHAKVGDPVILWGKGLPIERVARYADTIAYELVCHIGKRVRRQ